MNRKDTRHWQNKALLTAVWGLLAAAPPALGEGKIPDQARLLHGTARGRFERVSLPLSTAKLGTQPLAGVALSSGQLQTQGMAGNAFVNVAFTQTLANEQVTFRITAAQRHVNRYAQGSANPSATAWEYKVEYSSPSLGSGALCPGAAEDQWALALPGVWNGGAYTVNSSGFFAFACLPRVTAPTLGGVAAKCVELGYAPWQNNDPRIDGTSLSLSEGDVLRYHVACTSLASADYCGQATPNTLSGTPITLYHLGNVPTQMDESGIARIAGGPVREDYFFEAAWALVDAGTGQYIVSSTLPSRVRAQAVCLTKKRWSTLPVNGTCVADQDSDPFNDRLPDPRRHHDKPARYCEDYTQDELLQKGAVLFSYSKFLDAGLYRFKHISNGEYLTTSQILIKPTQPITDSTNPQFKTLYQPDPSVFFDADKYRLADNGLPDSYEGPLFKPNTPTHLFDSVAVSPLLRYRASGFDLFLPEQFLTLVSNSGVVVPANYSQNGVEGYVYAEETPPTSAPSFRLYRRGTGSYLSTIHTNRVPANYGSATPMGYLPPLVNYAAERPY
ncbi:ADYC domain-containing protein [Stigmatella sp. ncwal1]|uniref:ADYC domain-containing protein n=1 Tax=Stigmatella ashevillensis TaxID=2995309 RepID=A0ABT5DIE9_9BACT|nr:ADYC domain-containing protein [Stigmatella ashevillena]MDC0712548.1 ADYC domain-containing protein [Stigmatella ashevillena]